MLRDLHDKMKTTRHTERKREKITGFRQNTEVRIWAEMKQTGNVSREPDKLSLELQIRKAQLRAAVGLTDASSTKASVAPRFVPTLR